MFLLYFVIIFGITPLLYYFIARSKNARELKPIIPFITITFVSSLYELFGSLIFGWNVSYWFVFFEILAFLCIYYFYFEILQKQFLKLFLLILFLFLGFCFYLSLNFIIKDFFIVSSYLNTFTTLFILFFTIIWFRRLILDASIENLLENSTFYFISGFILYYFGTLFLFLISNYLYKFDALSLQSYWVVNIILNLILRIFLIVGLWKARTK
jgi:hypothetical protein